MILTSQLIPYCIPYFSQQPKIKPLKVTRSHIIFVDNRRKHITQLPAELTDIKRVDSINILGVTVTNTLTINTIQYSFIKWMTKRTKLHVMKYKI